MLSEVADSPTCLDLFCGIGGLTIGLERAGFRSLGGVDHWDDAAETFEFNLAPLRCARADLRTASTADLERQLGPLRDRVDLVSGGPPCQGYSTVGKRSAADPRNRLWESYVRLVEEIGPAYVLLENVEGMRVAAGGEFCRRVVRSLDEIGYDAEFRTLTSADYGVPQLRKRVIFLGARRGLTPPEFPAASGERVSVGAAIFDLPAVAAGERADRYAGPPRTDYQRARRKGRGPGPLFNHEAAKHPARLVEILKHVPDGGNRKSIPDALQPRSGFHNSYARLSSARPAVAVTSNMRKPSSARATHPRQHRGLTVREGLRLQSFDDDYVVRGSRTSQYLQVGNAVPPLLAERLGHCLIDAYRANIAQVGPPRKPAPPRRARGAVTLFEA